MNRISQSIIMVLVGLLIGYYAWRKQLGLFLLPEFHGALLISAFCFLVLGISLAVYQLRLPASGKPRVSWTSVLVILTLISGFLIPLRPLSSVTALQRGVSYDEPIFRETTPSFTIAPEERTLVDWLRQFNLNPEPTAYLGQSVRIEGFIAPFPGQEEQQMIAKFLIACCSADARPIGLPIQTDTPLPIDQWVELRGTMGEILIDGVRRPGVFVEEAVPIPVPDSPYEYL